MFFLNIMSFYIIILSEFKGWMFGDPHITTLDGLSYDYNGIGEYWMIKSNIVNVQARTSTAWDTAGKPVSASVFSAFAIQVPSGDSQTMSDRVFVAMNEFRDGKLDAKNMSFIIMHDSHFSCSY